MFLYFGAPAMTRSSEHGTVYLCASVLKRVQNELEIQLANKRKTYETIGNDRVRNKTELMLVAKYNTKRNYTKPAKKYTEETMKLNSL